MTGNSSMVYCRGCGKEIHQTALTCPQCGCVQNAVASTSNGLQGVVDKIMAAAKTCLEKYVDFKGTASREEFWYFYLVTVIAAVIGVIIDAIAGTDIVNTLVNLALLMPTLAAGTRRLQDIGRNGKWILIVFTGIGVIPLIYWWCQKGVTQNSDGGLVVATS